MNRFGKTARRVLEIADLTFRVVPDLDSKTALVSGYRSAFRNPNDTSEISLRLRWNGATFPVTIRAADVFTLAEIFFDREYAIRSRIPANPVIVDCGANVGLSPIWFMASFPNAAVYAIEPEPENFRLLSINVGPLPNAVITQAAVTRTSQPTTLTVAAHGAMHSIKDAAVGQRTIEVNGTNLVDYCRANGINHIDILKLDIEGSELDAMEGLGEWLRNVGVVVGELHESLVDEGRFYRVAEAHGFRRVKRAAARESGVHLFELSRV